MRLTSSTALLGLALLVGCAQPPAPNLGADPNLPASLRNMVADPAQTAINNTAAVFGDPASIAGRPAQAANAISQLEWLTVDIVTDQRWIGLQPQIPGQVRAGRDAVRQAFGVPAATTPQAAVSAFDGAAAALATNDRAGALTALAAVTGGQGGATRALGLLDALPSIPAAAIGTAALMNGIRQMNMQSGPRFR